MWKNRVLGLKCYNSSNFLIAQEKKTDKGEVE